MGLEQAIIDRISKEASVSSDQVLATISLLEKEATIPFIARYRKEVTGNLDEVQIRTISERQEYYRSLIERRESILKSIEAQGKLTDDLKGGILTCYEKAALEDIYLPYKPKKKTKAILAIEKGLEPLARYISDQVPGDKSIEEAAEVYINPEKNVSTREEAIEGALHIVAEWISEELEVRKSIRDMFVKEGMVVSKVNKDKIGQKTKFEMYYDFREPVSKIPSHRVLAIRRGVKEQVLSHNIEIDREKAVQNISSRLLKENDSVFSPFLNSAIKDSYDRLLNPNLQGEIRTLLKEQSDREAIKVFEENLTNLLLSPPAGPIVVMGVDPGFRTGCKIAVVDTTGKFLEHATIYPTEPRIDFVGSEKTLYRLVQKHGVQAIAIGNGTGSREADTFIKEFLRKYKNGEPLGVVPGAEEKGKDEFKVAVADGAIPELTQAEPSTEVSAPELKAQESSDYSLMQEAEAIPEPVVESLAAEESPAVGTDFAETRVASENSMSEAQAELGIPAPELAPEEIRLPESSEKRTVVEALPEERHEIFSVIVNESGASVYSASDSARREFPKLDLTVRGAISIARRLQDPLAELVKIHPKSIGVGQYQHDVDQKRLKDGLEAAVESCVNRVGVDLNMASFELLRYCSGMNQRTAKAIIDHRNRKGRFSIRTHLMQVPGFGEKAFEQAAGFLRIKDGDNPLDATAVHPESYEVVEKIARSLELSVKDLIENSRHVETLDLQPFVDEKVGLYTLNDIRQELLKPGRDPRDKFVVPAFRDDVKDVSDLQPGMVLEGTVTNVTNFGAFVDIGVHQDGLVHVSELSARFVQDPRDAVHVGQIVKVKVIGVDVTMKRISLSIKALLPERQKEKSVRKLKDFPPPKLSQPARAVAASAEATGKGQEIPKAKVPYSTAKKRKRPSHPPVSQKIQVAEQFAKPQQKTEQKHKPEKKTQPRKAESPLSVSALPFDEQIRLLQEKFSGIR
jgi:transcriptional accessory protein Tex/SPT6